MKKNLTTPDDDVIDNACQGLLDSVGRIKTAAERLRHHLVEFIEGDEKTANQFLAAVTEGQIFTPDAVAVVRQIGKNIVASTGAVAVATIVKRLRNDQQLKAVLRRAAEPQFPILETGE